ncbi:Sodium-driven chloride bicarbonate exchanger [Nymphon striatum]|nr:Sodium-driven chloride bicarbonate exchanger [Nymphon striatum]
MIVEKQPLVEDEVVRDQRAMSSHPSFSDFDIQGHRADASYTAGVPHNLDHLRRRGHHHHHRRHRHHYNDHKKSNGHNLSSPNVDIKPVTPPSQRVKFILGEDGVIDGREAHPLFSEMEELCDTGDDVEWREIARWVKFEEDVEEGGNRWSKPHVGTLGLHSLFELRSCLTHGTVILDMEAQTLDQIVEQIVDEVVVKHHLPALHKERVKSVLLKRHKHQYEKKNTMESLGSRLPLIRSLAEIGRNASKSSFLPHNSSFNVLSHHETINTSPSSASLHGSKTGANMHNNGEGLPPSSNFSSTFKQFSDRNSTDNTLPVHQNLLSPHNTKTANNNQECQSTSDFQSKCLHVNHHFMKKLHPESEALIILVGELDFLDRAVIVFMRLEHSAFLGDLTEVPIPTRFIFILLGPKGNHTRYREIGRAIGTICSDEVFHEIAYKARNKLDLLAGVDEFLDSVTVLPPGEWDPSIRIEPPQHVPSQQSRINQNKQEEKKDTKYDEAKELEESGLKRTGKLFGGFINDIKRKKPWYWSDFKDACAVQCLASFFFLYFACLAPIITFGGLLGAATKSRMAAMESLLSGAIVGVSYSLLSGQPLTILGSTGPVLVFESTVFNLSESFEWDYLSFRLWIGIWTALILIILVALDASAFVCYITRFTEENFATLISLIYIIKAFEELLNIQNISPLKTHPDILRNYNCSCLPSNNSIVEEDFMGSSVSKLNCSLYYNGTMNGGGCDTPTYVPDVFLMSVLLFFGTYIISVCLKEFKTAPFFPTIVRQIVSDFSVIIAIASMAILNAITGIPTPTLDVPNKLEPTWEGRTWVIDPFGKNPWWTAIIAVIPAFLCTILIFMDQQITAVIVNRKENKLKKGCGYHLDLFIVAVCIAICGILGLPWFVAATVLSITHVNSLKVESETAAPGEKPHFLGVREQRVTHFLVFVMIGLSVFLTRVLIYIPMPVLYGVFLYMGTSSLKGSQFVERIMLIFMPQKYQPDYLFLRHVPTKRVHLFTFIQFVCLVILFLIKSNKKISISFPLMVAAMVAIRKLLDFLFTQNELKILDDVMPEPTKRKREEEQEKVKNIEDEPILTKNNSVHIQLSTGNVMKIPAAKLQQTVYDNHADDSTVNISEEVPKTCAWKNIDQSSSEELNKKFDHSMRRRETIDEEDRKRLSIMNEDDENDDDFRITINIDSPTPLPSDENSSNNETSV